MTHCCALCIQSHRRLPGSYESGLWRHDGEAPTANSNKGFVEHTTLQYRAARWSFSEMHFPTNLSKPNSRLRKLRWQQYWRMSWSGYRHSATFYSKPLPPFANRPPGSIGPNAHQTDQSLVRRSGILEKWRMLQVISVKSIANAIAAIWLSCGFCCRTATGMS